MMSGHATIDAAVKATKLGASTFWKADLLERLLILLRNAATTSRSGTGIAAWAAGCIPSSARRR
jgi:DNA-binding NtrC family response regulator